MRQPLREMGWWSSPPSPRSPESNCSTVVMRGRDEGRVCADVIKVSYRKENYL